MKRLGKPLAAAIVLLAVAGTASAQTADEVIEKTLTAIGGRAALAKVKSRRTTGTITFQTPAGDVEGTVEVVNAAPNKTRTLIKADLTALGAGQMVVDQRFDGTTGYVIDTMQGNRDIIGNQLDNLRNGSFPSGLLTYKSQGIAAKLGGKEKVGDRDAYVLILEPPTGSAVRQYIDASTYLPLRAVVKVQVPQLGDLEQTSDMADYRDVDGVKLPFLLKVSSTAQNYTIAISKVEHNITLDEKQFVKP
jgi:outer membrane lipoprotein-sorting protein